MISIYVLHTRYFMFIAWKNIEYIHQNSSKELHVFLVLLIKEVYLETIKLLYTEIHFLFCF